MAGLAAVTGEPPSPETRRSFEQYLELFLRWNRTHRMTALSPAGVVRDLFLDSLLYMTVLPPRPLALADIGAGAGIPGLPLRLADPRITLTLIESRRKRVSFLRAVQRELGLENVVVEEGRAEELANDASFDAVVARAVANAGSMLPLALQYLKPGGVFVMSGPPNARPYPGFEAIRLPTRAGRGARTFLRAIKKS